MKAWRGMLRMNEVTSRRRLTRAYDVSTVPMLVLWYM